MDLQKQPSVKIGQYTIYQLGDILAWIEKSDGEGGEFFIKDIEKILDQFWKDKF